MRVCVYCKTRYQTGSGVTFHKFPTDSLTQKLWLRSMNVENWFPNINSYLCSKHFMEDCFNRYVSRTQLKKGSVPTIFSDSGVTIDEKNKKGEADIIYYNCIENEIDNMKLETFTMSDYIKYGMKAYMATLYPVGTRVKLSLFLQ